jgi:hypothetical protein
MLRFATRLSVRAAGRTRSRVASLACASLHRHTVNVAAAGAPEPPSREPFYVTTPIYYVNGAPHIGHVYTSLACDVMARFMRLEGREVFFLTGTDEHGQKVEQSAAEAGETPQRFADRMSQSFRALLDRFDLSCDGFIRTTEPRHATAAQALWRRLHASGDIYLGKYEGWYSVRRRPKPAASARPAHDSPLAGARRGVLQRRRAGRRPRAHRRAGRVGGRAFLLLPPLALARRARSIA